jgi:hypothetical protein
VTSMRIVIKTALAFVLACLPLSTQATAQGQNPIEFLHNENIEIEYSPPKTSRYKPIHEKVMQRKVLERFDTFLSPLRLKSSLKLSFEEGDPKYCKNPNSYFDDDDSTLHLCYSWFYMLEHEASKEYPRKPNEPFTIFSPGRMPGVTRAEVIIGGAVQLMLHELGHGLFHIQEIPRLGREEDAADQLASLLMLQFGNQVALTTIKGSFNVWHHFNAVENGGKISPLSEAGTHSINIQRAYNILCTAYGKDPKVFGELADRFLSPARKGDCAYEYQQAAQAFRKTFLPDIDTKLMTKVLGMKIIQENDYDE